MKFHPRPGGPTVHCDECGGNYYIGQWPFCKGDRAAHGKPSGQLGDFKERWDECIAPPPSDEFKASVPMPDYDPRRGWRVSTLAEQKRLMKLNRVDYRN